MMVNKPPIPKEWNGSANKNRYGFPGTIKNQSIMYPMMEILWEMMKARFLPNVFDILATIGITKNVVTSAPTLPKSVGQTPTAEASSLNKWLFMMKKVKLAMVLKPLKIKNVVIHNLRKEGSANASTKLLRMLPRLRIMFPMLSDS